LSNNVPYILKIKSNLVTFFDIFPGHILLNQFKFLVNHYKVYDNGIPKPTCKSKIYIFMWNYALAAGDWLIAFPLHFSSHLLSSFFYLPLSSLAISLIANSRQYCQQQQQPNIPINTNFTLPQCQQPQKQQKLQENSAKFFFYLWLQTWTATTTGELLRTKKGGTYRKRGKQGLFLA